LAYSIDEGVHKNLANRSDGKIVSFSD
jgi:hypothetical protein